MKQILYIIFIVYFILNTISCSKKDSTSSDILDSSTTDNSTTTDTTAPVIAEVTAVTTPTNDTTPDYTFSSSEAGVITYGGSCSSSTTSATTDNNTITFNALTAETYVNCTIIVTDSAGNASSTLSVNTFVVDTTAPTVSSISTTADNQSAVSITDNITVTFSKAIEPSYVTTSTSDTNCAGSIRVSSDNFSTCVKMSSEPVSSNSNRTFTLDPYDNLTFGSTYLTRVTTGAKDLAGNALSSQYETTNGFTTTEDISISSSASDNASVGIGSTYQYQVDTGGTYSDSVTYSLSNAPDNMTISSSGLVEWTPNTASDIKTHDNITITLTTASGYVLTESYDLTVTGTCVSGNVMSIWSGDQRSSTDSSKFLGNITAYTDNASSVKTASQNYNYSSSSVDLTHGPQATVNDGAMFFYNQYDNTTHNYLFYFFGMETGGATNKVSIDVFVANNASQDSNPVDDDDGETDLESQSQSATTGLWASSYTGRYSYGANSDGAVIGPFSNTDNQTLLDNGTTFKIFVDLAGTSSLRTSANRGVYGLTLGDLDSMKYYSKDNSTIVLGDHDNFTIGYKTRVTCE
jgi:heat shock protein HslJ